MAIDELQAKGLHGGGESGALIPAYNRPVQQDGPARPSADRRGAVLLVDDEDAVRTITAYMLEELEFDVT